MAFKKNNTAIDLHSSLNPTQMYHNKISEGFLVNLNYFHSIKLDPVYGSQKHLEGIMGEQLDS